MISCAIHDYIEIACLYHIRVRLSLRDDRSIEGEAYNTRTSEAKREYLVLLVNNQEELIELDQIKSMQALTANTHFDKVDF